MATMMTNQTITATYRFARSGGERDIHIIPTGERYSRDSVALTGDEWRRISDSIETSESRKGIDRNRHYPGQPIPSYNASDFGATFTGTLPQSSLALLRASWIRAMADGVQDRELVAMCDMWRYALGCTRDGREIVWHRYRPVSSYPAHAQTLIAALTDAVRTLWDAIDPEMVETIADGKRARWEWAEQSYLHHDRSRADHHMARIAAERAALDSIPADAMATFVTAMQDAGNAMTDDLTSDPLGWVSEPCDCTDYIRCGGSGSVMVLRRRSEQ